MVRVGTLVLFLTLREMLSFFTIEDNVCYGLIIYVAQMVKHLSAMQETRVRSLVREDPLEKAMAAHSSILAWKIPWTEQPGGLQPMGSQRVGHD